MHVHARMHASNARVIGGESRARGGDGEADRTPADRTPRGFRERLTRSFVRSFVREDGGAMMATVHATARARATDRETTARRRGRGRGRGGVVVARARDGGDGDGGARASARGRAVVVSDGTALEVRARDGGGGGGGGAGRRRRAPMVFVHGSYHAAWCWEEHFAGYFADKGRATRSVSLRAHGTSGKTPGSAASAAAGTLETHARDVAEVIEAEMKAMGEDAVAPIIVGHSFGGLVAQRVAADDVVEVGGVCLLASVPPTGNAAMVRRFLKRDFFASVKITYAFITKAFGTNAALCRECFFSPELPRADVERFAASINDSSSLRMLDLKTLDASLPVPRPSGTKNRDAPFFILGGSRDFVVDREGLEETSAWFAGELRVVDGLAHDVMLDADWRVAADAIDDWLERNNL